MACQNTQPTTTTYCPNNLCDEVCVELISDKCVIHKGNDIVCTSPALLIKEGDKLDEILAKLVNSICTIGTATGGDCACTIGTIPSLTATLAGKEGLHGYHEFNSINNSFVLPSLSVLQNKVFYITQMQGFRSGNRLKGPASNEFFRTLTGSTVSPNYALNNVVSLTVGSDGSQYIILNQVNQPNKTHLINLIGQANSTHTIDTTDMINGDTVNVVSQSGSNMTLSVNSPYLIFSTANSALSTYSMSSTTKIQLYLADEEFYVVSAS